MLIVKIKKCCKFCKYFFLDYEAYCQPYYVCELTNKQTWSNCVCKDFKLSKDYKLVKEVKNEKN